MKQHNALHQAGSTPQLLAPSITIDTQMKMPGTPSVPGTIAIWNAVGC